MKWVEFASNFPNELEAFHAKLKGLNEDLVRRSVLLDHGLQLSEADFVVFSAVHSFVNKEAFGETLATIVVSKPGFEHFVDRTNADQTSKKVDKTNADPTSEKGSLASKDIDKSERNINSVKGASEVLCASNQDQTVVEPLTPPEGAIIGERISFSWHEGKPEDILNPRKSSWKRSHRIYRQMTRV